MFGTESNFCQEKDYQLEYIPANYLKQVISEIKFLKCASALEDAFIFFQGVLQLLVSV